MESDGSFGAAVNSPNCAEYWAMQEYHYKNADSLEGVVAMNELQQLMLAGTIGDDTLVYTHDFSGWKRFDKMIKDHEARAHSSHFASFSSPGASWPNSIFLDGAVTAALRNDRADSLSAE